MIVFARYRARSKRFVPPDNFPTPESIREMTAEIRKAWTPREHRRRANENEGVELFQIPTHSRRKGFWDS